MDDGLILYLAGVVVSFVWMLRYDLKGLDAFMGLLFSLFLWYFIVFLVIPFEVINGRSNTEK